MGRTGQRRFGYRIAVLRRPEQKHFHRRWRRLYFLQGQLVVATAVRADGEGSRQPCQWRRRCDGTLKTISAGRGCRADRRIIGRMFMSHVSSIFAVALTAALFATPCAAQVADLGKYPNFKGQWVRGPGNPNNWRQLAGPPPLTPEYQKIFEESQAHLKAGGPGKWPSTFCIPAGMPAMMSLYDPMEMIVTPETTYILISHNDDSYRRIYTDGRDWPTDPDLTFAGYSIGKWIDEDGDG